jgi:GntR family transcriptional regulator, negative regulator for fad regulon and positive regulator of fabA
MKRTHEVVEKTLVQGLLNGEPQPGSHLQSERELAARFSVSRATVREALLKLQKSGWISVQQRHATVVNEFWLKGDLELLTSISRNTDPFPPELARDLLELRIQCAADWARRAVENDAPLLVEFLSRAGKLRNCCGTILRFDAELHLTMALLSRNKLYPLLINTFSDLYLRLKGKFFAKEEHRAQARSFYEKLLCAAQAGDAGEAESLTRGAMRTRLENFRGQSQGKEAAGTAAGFECRPGCAPLQS